MSRYTAEWDDARYMAFDFETSGTLPEYALQPWRIPARDMWATTFVWATWVNEKPRFRSHVSPSIDDMRAMLEHAIENNITIIGWNVTFDISILVGYGLGDLVLRCRWLDGMLLWRHMFIEPEYTKSKAHRKPYGLKAAVAEFMPQFAGYDQGIDFHSDDPETREKLLKYNKIDVYATFLLARRFYKALRPSQRRAMLLEADSLPLIAQANYEGMLVDTLAANSLDAWLGAKADALLEELEPEGVTETVIRSPTQLAEVMFDQWKLPVIKTNKAAKTGVVSRSTDKEVLHELSFIDPRAAKLKEYRETLNSRTKFAQSLTRAAAYNGDDRAHPLAIPFGTYTGRLTYASKQGKGKDERPIGFPLHQTRRDKIYREPVQAPPGFTLMEFDASGQEFRWMAIASNDPVMLSLCMPGEDPHSYMGAEIASKDYRQLIASVKSGDETAGEDRRLGKVANLSLQYRTSARKLMSVARVQYHMDMKLPMATRVHQTYPRVYRQVPVYWAAQIAATKRNGYVETFAGRRVVVRGDWGGNFGWSMGSTAINYRIQGTGGDQKYLALAVLQDYIVRYGIRFAWDMHDGLYFYVPDQHVERAAVEMKIILDNLPYQKAWAFTPPVPLPWDCKVGGSWGSLKER